MNIRSIATFKLLIGGRGREGYMVRDPGAEITTSNGILLG